jgi:hypothetical protein
VLIGGYNPPGAAFVPSSLGFLLFLILVLLVSNVTPATLGDSVLI